jgi:hypothetical protein
VLEAGLGLARAAGAWDQVPGAQRVACHAGGHRARGRDVRVSEFYGLCIAGVNYEIPIRTDARAALRQRWLDLMVYPTIPEIEYRALEGRTLAETQPHRWRGVLRARGFKPSEIRTIAAARRRRDRR